MGKKKETQPISNLALDRIIKIDYDFNTPVLEHNFNAEKYYKNVVGVTTNERVQPKVIQLKIDAYNAPYIITKPIHNTQRIIQQNDDGSIIVNLFLIENFELERIILGFGASIEVLKPERLRHRMQFVLEKALRNYSSILE